MAVGVRVKVLVGVLVNVLVAVLVNVGVFVGQGGRVNVSMRPCDKLATLHENEVEWLPVSRCTPTVALLPDCGTWP